MKTKILILLLVCINVFGQTNIKIEVELLHKMPCDTIDTEGFILKTKFINLTNKTVFFDINSNLKISLKKKLRDKQYKNLKFEDITSYSANNSTCWLSLLEVQNEDNIFDREMVKSLETINKVKINKKFENNFIFIPPNKETEVYKILPNIYEKVQNGDKYIINVSVNSIKKPIVFSCNKSILFPSDTNCKDLFFIKYPLIEGYAFIKAVTRKTILLDKNHIPKNIISTNNEVLPPNLRKTHFSN